MLKRTTLELKMEDQKIMLEVPLHKHCLRELE